MLALRVRRRPARAWQWDPFFRYFPFAAIAVVTGQQAIRLPLTQLGRSASRDLGHGPSLTALFTSAPILFSSASLSSVSAKLVGHMVPSSRFAASSNQNVAYLDLNFDAGLKKQTTLPSLLA